MIPLRLDGYLFTTNLLREENVLLTGRLEKGKQVGDCDWRILECGIYGVENISGNPHMRGMILQES